MAFCNSCGASLASDAKFCNKCGATIAGAPPAPTAAPVAPVPSGGSSALKIVLIVVAAIVVIGILGAATVGIIGYRLAKSSHITQEGDHVKVETPFGTVESSKDPEKAAQDLGVDVYPGAKVQDKGAASATFGGIRTVTANFETSDSVEKVCDFYRQKFPSAVVTTSEHDHCAIMSSSPPNNITINIQADGDTTKIQIAKVSKN